MYVYCAFLFYVCCSDCMGGCGNVCYVEGVAEYSGVLSLGVLKYVYACIGNVMDVMCFVL